MEAGSIEQERAKQEYKTGKKCEETLTRGTIGV
jgi:hypothetical protein